MDDEYMYEVSAAVAYEQGFHDGYNQAMDEIESLETKGVKPLKKINAYLCPLCYVVIERSDQYCSQCGTHFVWEEQNRVES